MQKQSITPLEELTLLRRHLHQYPELSFQEYNTQKYIYEFCKDFDCEISFVKTGILLFFNLQQTQTIAFRAELDALPILEKTEVDYKSKNQGIMHACGHDGHMAILMLLAKYINSNKKKLKNNYLLIFQPSEEVAGGSKSIIESEAFNKHLPNYIFALHVYPTLTKNRIYYHQEAFLAMCVEIDIHITGKNTHIMNMQEAIDSIRIANELMKQLYEYYDSLNFDETRFLIGVVTGGKQRNIVSDSTLLKISLRNFDQNNYLIQKEKIKSIIHDLIKIYHCKIEINFNEEIGPVFNDIEVINKVKIKYKIYKTDQKLIGDDFAQYHHKCKTGYFLLGIESPFLHEDTFYLEEKVLLKGFDFFKALLNI